MTNFYDEEDEVQHLKKFIVYELTNMAWTKMAASVEEIYEENGTDESDYFAIVEEASGVSFHWDDELDNWVRND